MANSSLKPFIDYVGIDTETINGYCRLLCLSDGSNPFRITKASDLNLFFKRYLKNRKTFFMAWNADYDIQAIIKWFPKKAVELLLKGLTVDYDDGGVSFQCQYIKNKYFEFDGNYIFDALQYYGLSLKRAAAIYLPEEAGKLDVDASAIDEANIYSDDVIRYCERDALLALKLYLKFHSALPDTLKRVKPISNAYLSFSHFRTELSSNRAPNKPVNDYFRNGYHGGRFEIFERGHFKDLYVYDINSAYPFEISNLRDLSRGRVVNFPGYFADSSFSMYKVKVRITDKFVSPVLSSNKGLCVYPVGNVHVWATKSEYERLIEYGPEIVEGFHIIAGRGYPFREKVFDLYDKKLNSGFQLPFKVILNSLYGKTGQATVKWVKVSDVSDSPDIVDFIDSDGVSYIKFEDLSRSNFIYASEITARVRCRMYDLVKQFPEDIVMVQTDSVISKRPIDDLNLSTNIGEWKLEKWEEAYLIGSGVYFYKSNGVWKGKFRGYNFRDEQAETILETILTSKTPKVAFKSKKRYSLQEAARIHDDEIGNRILEVTRSMNLNFDSKRGWLGKWKSGTEIPKKNIRSLALYQSMTEGLFDAEKR